jgi:chromosome segregation ATPase
MVESYSSKTVSYNVEGSDELKSRMKHISGGLETLKNRIASEAHHIDELRGMFDVSYLNELTTMMEDLEIKISGMEGELNSAIVESDKYRKQLASEQERLAKLWEVYKKQEEEITGLRRQMQEMRGVLGEKDKNISEMNSHVKSLESLKDLAQYKDKYEALTRKYSQVEDYANQQSGRVSELENYAKTLEPLKEYAQYRDKAEAIGRELEMEKERLAKLYKVYEDTDAQLRTAKTELESWNAWFAQYKDVFGTVGDAANQRRPFLRRSEGTVKKTFEK